MEKNLELFKNQKRAIGQEDEKLLPIVEYSRLFGVSVSTIRRKIRSRKLDFIIKEDKYYIKLKNSQLKFAEGLLGSEIQIQDFELLKQENKKLKEEIEELKMLIEAYEKYH